MKARISLGLSKLSIPTKIEKARHVVTVMAGNANFTTPLPTLASVTTAINNLETAYNAAQGAGPAQTAFMHDKEALLDNALLQLANYVEIVSNGSEAIVLSSGMELRGKGGRTSVTFTVEDGEHSGEMLLHTKSEKRASYVWQMVSDPLPTAIPAAGHDWKQLGISTKASFIASDLIAGVKYWFRFASINKDGQSPWSDPISKIAGF